MSQPCTAGVASSLLGRGPLDSVIPTDNRKNVALTVSGADRQYLGRMSVDERSLRMSFTLRSVVLALAILVVASIRPTYSQPGAERVTAEELAGNEMCRPVEAEVIETSVWQLRLMDWIDCLQQQNRNLAERIAALETGGLVTTVWRGEMVVHTYDQDSPSWDEMLKYRAPQVPVAAQEYSVENRCPATHLPAIAWHEVTGSHPGGTMYTIDVNTDGEEVTLSVRAREGQSGYAYIDVFVLCRSAE